MYFYYFFEDWMLKCLKKIEETMYITYKNKFRLVKNDVIIIYVKNSSKGGIYGYIIIDDEQQDNIKISKDKKIINHPIFEDDYYDMYITPINKIVILKKHISVSSIIDDVYTITLIKKEIRTHNTHELKQMCDDTGRIFKRNINKMLKQQIKYENEKLEKRKKEKEKSKKEREEKEKEKKKTDIKKPYVYEEKYSEYIIPIVIFPCENIEKKMKEVEPSEKTSKFMRHIKRCQKCLMYNNNERVSLDMIKECETIYYKMKDKGEIKTVLKFYHNLEYYVMEDTEKSHMTLIKIYNKDFEYHKCYVYVGRLHKKY